MDRTLVADKMSAYHRTHLTGPGVEHESAASAVIGQLVLPTESGGERIR
jgi:hypothetical protein